MRCCKKDLERKEAGLPWDSATVGFLLWTEKEIRTRIIAWLIMELVAQILSQPLPEHPKLIPAVPAPPPAGTLCQWDYNFWGSYHRSCWGFATTTLLHSAFFSLKSLQNKLVRNLESSLISWLQSGLCSFDTVLLMFTVKLLQNLVGLQEMDKKKVASETKKKSNPKCDRQRSTESNSFFIQKVLESWYKNPCGWLSCSSKHLKHFIPLSYLAANQTWGNREALILSSAYVFFPSKHSFAIYSWNFSWHLELAEAEV